MLRNFNVLSNEAKSRGRRSCFSIISYHVLKELVPLTDHKGDISKRFVLFIHLLIRNVNESKDVYS